MTTPDDLSHQFDLGIWYTISLWPALHLALQNSWGGPDSASKRDWFAGAISDLFATRPETDQIDVETVLLQVMQDEFDVNVEDESEVPVAVGIMKLRREVLEEGRVEAVEEVRKRWEEGRGRRVEGVKVTERTVGEDGEVVEGSSDEESEDEDEEMGEAPALVQREKVEPEVDEDGFTKVVGKKRR